MQLIFDFFEISSGSIQFPKDKLFAFPFLLFESEVKMLLSRATRYAFLWVPLFLASSPSTFLLSFPCTLHLKFYLHSRSPYPNNIHDAVVSFNRTIHKNPPPSILEINKILGSIAKMKYYATAISLFAQMESKDSPHVYMLWISWSIVTVTLVRWLLLSLYRGRFSRGVANRML